ncbi:predicted protein [Naegleria gruberi]|uniref:Predicted protein n=1 Tax=Naegleria gruberi TaxID=5762 RepID=D2UZ41_NAEGR|nr:uncharacterized protein NAEGRDRAFT_45389 [Naegleria gruberi]EFC49879.1 predicted protein [Naegleria gruberi]|eukprot:XP_002682623.1 predicted protein [Naegleria gruberi strain NEG-M]
MKQTSSLSETFAFVNSDEDEPKSIFLDIEKSSDEKLAEQEITQKRKRKIEETINYFNSIKKQKNQQQANTPPFDEDDMCLITLEKDNLLELSDLSDDDRSKKDETKINTKQVVHNKASKLDQALSKLNEKKKSTISQSKQDWKQYKEKEGIEHELKQYTKDGYLEKQSFLERTEMREFEIDKDLRNAERKRKEQQNANK